MSALDTQTGGNHYRQGGIQPIQFIEANHLQFLEGSIVKRATRHDKQGGKGRQDIEKIIHEAQLLLELRYGTEAKKPPQVVIAEDDGAAERIGENLYRYRGTGRVDGIGSTWQEAQQDYFRRNK